MANFRFTNSGGINWNHLVIYRANGIVCVKFDDGKNGLTSLEKCCQGGQDALLEAIGKFVKLCAEDREEGSTENIEAADISDEYKNIVDARIAAEEAAEEVAEEAAEEAENE